MSATCESLFRAEDDRRLRRMPIICAVPAKQTRSAGGAETRNVFTRLLVALYGRMSWRATPVMPVEICCCRRGFHSTIDKISHWAHVLERAVAGAAGVQATGAQSARRRHRRVVSDIRRARSVLPKKAPHQKLSGFCCSAASTTVLRAVELMFPKKAAKAAIDSRRVFRH